MLCTYRAFLYDPVEHDDRFGLLLPDHEPKMAAGVPEWSLWTTNTHFNFFILPLFNQIK